MSDPQKPIEPVQEPPDVNRPASSTPPAAAPEHDPYAALRSRDFCLYLAGFIVGVIGDQILEVAVGWDIYLRTHRAMSLGWVGLVSAAPIILLALPAGHLADRMDRKRIVLISQLLRAVCVAALGILSYRGAAIGAMYALLCTGAVFKALGWPARSAMMPSLVETAAFANAVNWNSTGFQISAMAGPAIGGWIIVFNLPAAYIAAAVCVLVFALSLSGVRPRVTPQRNEPATLKSLAAGVRFVWSTKIILATITLDLFAVLLGGATYLLPIFAKEILAVGAVGLGWLKAAPAVGAMAMGLTIAHLPPMKRAGRAMLLAVVGFGAATIVFGLSKNFWLSIAMLTLVGAFDNISVLVRHTLVQVLTPDDMRGRVSAVNNIFVGASNELGGFESGWTAEHWGTIPSVVIGGIGTILVVIATRILWPAVAKFGSLVDARPEESSSPVKV